jgi:hypothetical protein
MSSYSNTDASREARGFSIADSKECQDLIRSVAHALHGHTVAYYRTEAAGWRMDDGSKRANERVIAWGLRTKDDLTIVCGRDFETGDYKFGIMNNKTDMLFELDFHTIRKMLEDDRIEDLKSYLVTTAALA